jgi:hypothetical protein
MPKKSILSLMYELSEKYIFNEKSYDFLDPQLNCCGVL